MKSRVTKRFFNCENSRKANNPDLNLNGNRQCFNIIENQDEHVIAQK